MAATFGDTDYRKPPAELIRDLIEKANPGFKAKAPVGSYTLETPVNVVVVAPSVNDTSVRLMAASGQSKIVGSSTLKYRRINLTKLFNGRTVVIEKYTVANTLPFADVVALIAEQMGVNLDPADFVGPTGLSADNPYNWNMAAGSLCYKGSIRVTWTKGKRDVAEMLGDGVLAGRVWPEGLVDIQDDSKPQGEMLFYDTDFSAFVVSLNSWAFGSYDDPSGTALGNLSNIIAFLKTIRPEIAWSRNDYRAVVGGLSYVPNKRYTLPNAAVPEANSGMYNRVVVFEPTVAGAPKSWFFGRILLHYNA